MKKFNVKVLSMAVTAAVASGAAGAAEVNFAKAVGSKADQGQAAFATVFGENTTYDKDTGKLTFKKDKDGLSDPLLVKTLELEQTINGFASGSNFITTDDNGDKTIREATNADIEADSLKGVGLAGRITAVNTRVDNLAKDVDEALDERDKAVDQLVDELKNTIASNNKKIADDMTAMGEEISDQFDAIGEDVTAVNTRVDTLEQDTAAAKASAKAAEDKVTELSANIDSKVKEAKDAADKAVDAASKIDAVAEKADKASKGVEILAKAAMEALEVNRQDIDANKAAIETKADKSEVEAAQKAAAQAALATIENARELNGFKEGDQIVVAKDDGSKVIRTATKEDVENADFEGVGLKEVVTEHDEALFELAATVNDNSEALVKTAEVVNAISADVNANKALLEAQGEANKGFNNAIASLDKDIGDLALAGKAAADALEANRQDIDANKAAIAENTASLKEQEKANDGFNNAIASLDKDIGDLASAGKAAMEALEVNRKDIDANKKYIGDLALAGKAAADALEANRQDIDANKAAIAENTASLKEQEKANDGFNNAIASLDKDIGDLALAGKAAADALEANRQDIDANKAAIAENTASLKEQEKANDGFNNAIASLDKDIITLKKADLAAADALKAHRTDIDANKAAIETKADKTAVESVRTIAVEAQKSAQVAKGAVEVAQKSAENADSHAKAAQTAAAKAQESADTNAVQIAANTKQIDTNKTDIAALQTANGQHAAGIAKNSARIDSLDKNVANLRKETRQGLAAQAALSGLFQPYSVGKFNVTAALGGFKSDTAVAVGAGYRFNENFAAKAGLAVGTSSGGSASYNVGLNYEW